VHLGVAAEGPTLTRIDLLTEADVPGLDAAAFAELAGQAKTGCLVSRALAGVATITLEATLLGPEAA
jgi:osmotically inducible protein OsmC